MKRVILIVSVSVEVLVLSFLLCWSGIVKKSAEKSGNVLAFEVSSFDPVHPLKGHYAELTVKSNYLNVEDADEETLREFGRTFRFYKKRSAYVTFDKDEKGRCVVKGLRKNIPDDEKYFVKALVSQSWDFDREDREGKFYIEYNFTDYYLQENLGEKIDSLSLRETESADEVLELYVNGSGLAVQKSLTAVLDEKRVSIEEYLLSKVEK